MALTHVFFRLLSERLVYMKYAVIVEFKNGSSASAMIENVMVDNFFQVVDITEVDDSWMQIGGIIFKPKDVLYIQFEEVE